MTNGDERYVASRIIKPRELEAYFLVIFRLRLHVS